MLSVVTAITGLLGTIGQSWMEKRKIRAEGKIKIEEAKINAKVRKVDNLHDLDQKSVSDMRFSWKDEFWSLVFGLILLASFIPQTQPYIKEGFVFMKESTPWWFEYSLVGIIAASFGLRGWQFWKNNK